MRPSLVKHPRLFWSTLTVVPVLVLATFQYFSFAHVLRGDANAASTDGMDEVESRNDASALTTRIAAHSLFGAPVTEAPKVEDLPETTLHLLLRGVVASTNPEQSSAMIENPDEGRVSNYAVGSTLPGGVIVEEIHGDKVVLNRAGSLETLLFPVAAAYAATPTLANRAPVSANTSATAPAQPLRQRESEAERDARLSAGLQQRASSGRSLEERLNALRNVAAQQ